MMYAPLKPLVLAAAVGAMASLGAGCGDSTNTAATTQGGVGNNGGGGGAPSTGGAGNGGAGLGGGGHGGAGTGGIGGDAPGGRGGDGGAASLTVAECYADDFVIPLMDMPDYDQFGVVVGSHCRGTNHQDITQVERVVFLGDSVTVGTPPTLSNNFYRAKLAQNLANKFGLSGPFIGWNQYDPINGVGLVKDSGDFSNCSKWGARTDDLQSPQIDDCFPPSSLDKRTLVVITIGGNDLSNLTQNAIDGASMVELQQQVETFVALMEDAVAWLKTPGRFPSGVFVVFGNMYEFTDGTGDVESCDVSGLAGFDEPIPSPSELAELVIFANEEFARIAKDYDSDMIFMLEDFCGHGFNATDPSAPCYRGPNSENWFDLTCIHPNPTGHQQLADMFMAVVNE